MILAAGQGTRMRSPRPKVLHPVAGRPMIRHALALAGRLGSVRTVVVVPPRAPEVRQAVEGTAIVEQAEQRGTGHAVLQARERLHGASDAVLVVYGDTPLLRPETARRLLDALDGATMAVLTADLSEPAGYGRIVRQAGGGAVARIVEEREARGDPAVLAIREVNSGVMAFEAGWLWERVGRLRERSQGEYYLTDLVQVAREEGRTVAAVKADEPAEALGVNSQAELAEANRVAWGRAVGRLMALGVTVLDPATTYVDADLEVGPGTVIHPNTHLQSRTRATRIGRECEIGPNSIVVDSEIGDRCRVWASVVEGSTLEADVQVGPFAHLRPGCYVESGVELGNYAEAKNSRIGRDSKVHHFSYIGDATVGQRVNIGAGTITCNYDGRAKHRTVIGDDVFVGSDSMLVAPVTIGARGRTGAGAVVTRDVPEDVTVVGVPARVHRPAAARETDGSRPDGAQKDGE